MARSRMLMRVLVGLAATMLAGAGFWAAARGGGEAGLPLDATAAPVAAATDADVPIPVDGQPAVRDTLVLTVTAAGQAAAARLAVLTAEVAGRVVRVPVAESDAVAAGDPLLAVDASEYELGVEEARARVAKAEAAYREMTLFSDADGAEVRAERARVARVTSGLDEAEVALRRARLELERAAPRAPFAGRVASVRVVPGQYVRPGDELMTLVDLDPIEVEVQVLESELTHLAPGAGARIHLSAFPGEVFAGRVATINPLVDEATRTAKVTVTVPNPGGRVLPGMYARVVLDAQRLPDRLLVPREAILERDRRTMLFVLDDGRAKWRYVATGPANDEWVELVPSPGTDAVEPGEIVLTSGHYTLIHDARVRLVDELESGGGLRD